MLEDRRHLAIEIAIEQIDQSLRRQTVGKLGEAAHVGEPDRRVNLLGMAAADLPGEHALAGILPDIGRQQNVRHPVQGANLRDPGQRDDNGIEAGDFRVGKSARLQRRPRGEVNVAVGEAQRRDHVVGDALGAQVVQDRIIKRAIGIGEPAAKRLAGFGDMRHRAVAKDVAIQQIETAVGDDRPGIRPPDETAADDLRMQGAHEHDDAPQRQAAGRQALADFAQDLLRQRRRPRAVHQPVDHRFACRRGPSRCHVIGLAGRISLPSPRRSRRSSSRRAGSRRYNRRPSG